MKKLSSPLFSVNLSYVKVHNCSFSKIIAILNLAFAVYSTLIENTRSVLFNFSNHRQCVLILVISEILQKCKFWCCLMWILNQVIIMC
jgi:hypothetical protein